MYAKQTWVDGEVLLSSKLNHIEDGVEENNLPEINVANRGGYLGVVADEDNTTDVVVIPQQTVTLVSGDDYVEVTYDFSSVPQLKDGCYGTIEVGGVQYDAWYDYQYGNINNTTQDEPPYYSFHETSKPTKLVDVQKFWVFKATNIYSNIVPGTYTVKCTLHIPSAKWDIIYDNTSGGGDELIS